MTFGGLLPPSKQTSILSLAMDAATSVHINADQYLLEILRRETVARGIGSPALMVFQTLRPIITRWAGKYLAGLAPSGSFAKATGNHSGTDIDIFISLSSNTPETLRDIYEKLFERMKDEGYTPKRQNVSINVRIGAADVDLVPGRRQDTFSTDHSLYRRRVDVWTKTNVHKHIQYVRNANRIAETRIIKLWRNQTKLDFPSFYLEMVVIEALRYQRGTLSANVAKILEYLRDTFPNARFIDPANTNNIISNDLTVAEKQAIRSAAIAALSAPYWRDIVV
jgi:hypothetical protein